MDVQMPFLQELNLFSDERALLQEKNQALSIWLLISCKLSCVLSPDFLSITLYERFDDTYMEIYLLRKLTRRIISRGINNACEENLYTRVGDTDLCGKKIFSLANHGNCLRTQPLSL